MSNLQTSNSSASNDNLLDQNDTETTDIVELADEQLEAVAGGLSFNEFISNPIVSTLGKVVSWGSPVGLAVSHGIVPILAAGNAASDARRSGGNPTTAAKDALIDAHKEPLQAFLDLFRR